MKAIKLLTIVSALLFSAHSQANIFDTNSQERTEIMLDEVHFQGQQLVRIKKRIANKLAAHGSSINSYKLVGITLHAKSRQGKGKATLLVGHDTDTRRVKQSISPFGNLFDGFGQDIAWADNGGKTFHTIHWNLYGQPGLTSEKWQIRFKGNIKVDYMEVHLESSLEKVRIRLNDNVYGTANNAVSDKVRLKKALIAKGYSPKHYRLRAVRLVGKSKAGHGTATLITGNNNQGSRTLKVARPGYSFASTERQSYRRVEWTGMNAGAINKVWQIQLKGRNRLKAAVVVLEAK